MMLNICTLCSRFTSHCYSPYVRGGGDIVSHLTQCDVPALNGDHVDSLVC